MAAAAAAAADRASSSQQQPKKVFDLVVFGATGFTGTLVAHYLANATSSGGPYAHRSWAIAGRDRAKLIKLKVDLVQTLQRQQGSTTEQQTTPQPVASSICGILEADVNQPDSIHHMCARAKVVLACVGPFLKYGTPLVQACIANKTHYVDITGETIWVRRMIDQYQEQAKQAGVVLVSMAGFDSVPADCGTLFAMQQLNADICNKNNGDAQELLNDDVDIHVSATVRVNGGFSGGTLSSMLNFFKLPLSDMKEARSPYLLNPDRGADIINQSGGKSQDVDAILPTYDQNIHGYTAPFIMAGTNCAVVRRSAALAALQSYADKKQAGAVVAMPPYGGARFHYRERMDVGGSWYMAMAITCLLVTMAVLGPFRIVQWLLQFVLPRPGEGQSETTRAKNWFKYTLHASRRAAPSAKLAAHRAVVVEVSGGDAYEATARCQAETGMCLLERDERGELRLPGSGGFLTPAAACGTALIQKISEVRRSGVEQRSRVAFKTRNVTDGRHIGD